MFVVGPEPLTINGVTFAPGAPLPADVLSESQFKENVALGRIVEKTADDPGVQLQLAKQDDEETVSERVPVRKAPKKR